MLDKLFGRSGRPHDHEPEIWLGRYSDNNKTLNKENRWAAAEKHFSEKNYSACFEAFFDYLKDDETDNLSLESSDNRLSFSCKQGSSLIQGTTDGTSIIAETALASMEKPIIPVMRRLLEQNFGLQYTRYFLKDNLICMRFDSYYETANPNKLYAALKELGTRSDRQDDQLLKDFIALNPVDRSHIRPLPPEEREIKFKYLHHFISQTIHNIARLDQGKLAAGISYMLLALLYRLDYLVAPEGVLRNELEKIISGYYSSEEADTEQKNHNLSEAIAHWLGKTREEIFPCLIFPVNTFAITTPQPHKVICDVLDTARQNARWYIDNHHETIAGQILEYGFSHCQYSYSLPRPLSLLYRLFMQVNYPEYFKDMGFDVELHDREKNHFNIQAIEDKAGQAIEKWKDKFPGLYWPRQTIRYDSLFSFNHSFISAVQQLAL
jgi:hypothetical protein